MLKKKVKEIDLEEEVVGLTEDTDEAIEYSEKGDVAPIYKLFTVAAKKLNVRQEPNSSGKIIGILSEKEEVCVEQMFNEWAYVSTKSNVDGYVMMDFLKEK